MTKVKIVTDSTADIPKEIVDKYDIEVIPLTIIMQEKTYLDRIDFTNEEFYQVLRTCEELPTTSQITPAIFAETYLKLAEEGVTDIVSIHLASELSGTYQSSVIAARLVADKVKVHCIDSKTATIGLGLVAMTVAQAAAEGKSLEEVLAIAEEASEKTNIYFLLDSLDNLYKGGRIGKAGQLVGSLLNIKPVLNLHAGEISAYEKVRGNREGKALERLIEILKEKIDPSKELHCVIGYSDNLETAQYMAEKLKEHLQCEDFIFMQIGCVIGIHIGLGAVGMAFYQ